MIVLLKFFNRLNNRQDTFQKNLLGAKPYALIENNRMLDILDEEIRNMFPNNGKVYVSEFISIQNKEESFRICELQETYTYKSENPSSIKYGIKKEANEYSLIEIIDIDDQIKNNEAAIVKLLRNGISIAFHLSNPVVLRTEDDMLIGPIQLEFSDGLYFMKEKDLNFIPYYNQEIEIFKIPNYNRSLERLFSIDKINEENLQGWIDVASNQKIINETINQIKDHMEFSGLSRKMISKIKERYSENNLIKERHLKMRFERSIEILEKREFDEQLINIFTQQLLQLPVVDEIITQQTKKAFETEYNLFVENNNELILKNGILNNELNSVQNELRLMEIKLNERASNLQDFEETVTTKINQIMSNVHSVYIDQALNVGLPAYSNVEIDNRHSVSNTSFSTRQSASNNTVLDDFECVKNIISENLKFVKGKDEGSVLAATLIAASALNEPIIIYGENAFDFAQMLARSIASEEIITFIPEIETFNLENLHQKFIQYNSLENTKAFIIHDPHLTSAVYSLPTYLKQIRWSNTVLIPNLIIISIEEIDEAKELLRRMPKSPLICTDDYFKRYLSLKDVQQILPGQMKINSFEGSADSNTIALKNKFISWLNSNEEVEVNAKKVNALILWLNYMDMLVSKETLFEWIYKVFKSVIILNEE